MQRIVAELYVAVLRGVVVDEGSRDFGPESEFTVRSEDGALVKVQGCAVDVNALES